MRFESLARTLLVNPGSALGSKITFGMPRIHVASIIGPAAYPPTPNAATGWCLLRMRIASSKPGPRIARFFASVTPPLPLSPPARSVSSGSPACGTSFISIPRCVPTSTTSLSLPLDNHSRAIAIAGKTGPPVPPPAIKSFTKLRFRLLTDIQEHARGQQHHQHVGAAVADKRQRDSLGRHEAEHDDEINQRLEYHHRGDAEREQPAETVGRGVRGSNSTPSVDAEESDHDHGADEAKFFTDHRVDEVGVRFGKIEEFLLALHEANASETTGADGDERLQQLETGAKRIGVRIKERRQSRLAVCDVVNQKIERGQRGADSDRQPFPGQPGDEQNRGRDENDVYGRTEIGLRDDEHHEEKNRSDGGENRLKKIFFVEFHRGGGAAFHVEKPCEIQNDRELGEFRWLDADWTEFNPAMRGVRLVEEEGADQHQ